MHCPACNAEDTRVVDSRAAGDAIRRRRVCQACSERFTTHERMEQRELWVVKKDGRRELFDRDKVLRGLGLACRKRPLSRDQLDGLTQQVEDALRSRRAQELPAHEVGAAVMDVLRGVDDVAYVRFASVYREFESVEQFIETIRPLRQPMKEQA